MKNKLFVTSLVLLALGLILLISQITRLVTEEKYVSVSNVAGINSTINSTDKVLDQNSQVLKQRYLQIGLLTVTSLSLLTLGSFGIVQSLPLLKEKLDDILDGEEPLDFE